MYYKALCLCFGRSKDSGPVKLWDQEMKRCRAFPLKEPSAGKADVVKSVCRAKVACRLYAVCITCNCFACQILWNFINMFMEVKLTGTPCGWIGDICQLLFLILKALFQVLLRRVPDSYVISAVLLF